MKRLFLVVLCTMISVAAFAQAKKPTIMVVPADHWCVEKGYYDMVNINGTEKQVVNYEKALLNNDLNAFLVAHSTDTAFTSMKAQEAGYQMLSGRVSASTPSIGIEL